MRRSSTYIYLALITGALGLYYFCNPDDGYGSATTRPSGSHWHFWRGGGSSSGGSAFSSSTSRGGFGGSAGAHSSGS